MKRIVTLFGLIFFGFALIGQSEYAKLEIEMYTSDLRIQESQMNKLEEIIMRKYSDLEKISENRSADENLYRTKRRSIYQGTHNSIRLLLKEEQLDFWTAYEKEVRLRNAKLIKDLNTINASKNDLMDAQYGIEN